jgi:hypothetical protein
MSSALDLLKASSKSTTLIALYLYAHVGRSLLHLLTSLCCSCTRPPRSDQSLLYPFVHISIISCSRACHAEAFTKRILVWAVAIIFLSLSDLTQKLTQCVLYHLVYWPSLKKLSLLQAVQACRAEMLRIPHCVDSRKAALYSPETLFLFLVLISVRYWVNPRP